MFNINIFGQDILQEFGARRRHPRRAGKSVAYRGFESLEPRLLLTAGDPDLTFGIGGKVVDTEFREGTSVSDTVLASALQSDGKIVAAGEGGIARYLPNGSLDVTFGTGGRIEYSYFARSLAIQADGKIVIAGGNSEFNSTDFIVSRYLSSGAQDTTFDGDGHAVTDFGSAGETVNDIVIQPNGRIVAVGSSSDLIAVACYTVTGGLDTSFDGDGRLLRKLNANRSDAANAVALQADGRIVVAGLSWVDYSYSSTNHDFFVMRLNANGSLDSTFSNVGFTNTTFGSGLRSYDDARNVVIQSDGRIVVTGFAEISFNAYTVVARYNSNGTLDAGFDGDGYKLLPTAGAPNSRGPGGEIAVLQPDGKLVTSTNGSLYRLNVDGSTESSFSAGGVLKSAIVQPDNKFVIGGSFHGWFGLVRTDTAGARDSGFSADGIVLTDFGPAIDVAAASVLHASGKITVVGSSNRSFAVAQYNSDGSLDPSFSQDGRTTIDFGAGVFESGAADVALQPDGKVIVAGYVRRNAGQSGYSDIAIVRLNAGTGTLDPTFGVNGIVITNIADYSGATSGATSVAIQPDGRVVVGGYGGGGFFTVVRYLPNGSLDRSFSGDGILSIVTADRSISIANDIAILPDGHILAVGDYSLTVHPRYSSAMMMVRMNSNGSLDSTFGTNGRFFDWGNRQRTANEVALLADGSFLVAGNATAYVETYYQSSRMAVSKYMANPAGASWTAVETVLYTSDHDPFSQGEVDSVLRSMVVQPNGRIVLAGTSQLGVSIVRLSSSGERDSSFNGDGRLTMSFGTAINSPSNYQTADLLRQPNGRLIIVGSQRSYTYPGPVDSDFVLARLIDADEAPVSTNVRINVQGYLEIKDWWSRDDQIELRHVGNELWVTDLTPDSRAVFTVTDLPTITGNGTKQIRIPQALIAATGKPLIVNGLGGDDSLSIYGYENILTATGLWFLGGLGTDKLRFENYTVPSVWYVGPSGNGSVSPSGLGTRHFSSVETFVGGSGDDEFRIAAATSTVLSRVDAGAGADLLRVVGNADMLLTDLLLTVSGTLSQKVALRGFEEAALIGGIGNNILDAVSFPGKQKLYGLQGNDELRGGYRDNYLDGGDGDDQLFSESGKDILRGGAGNDLLVGGSGDDILYGDDGNDILVGDHGVDILRGGAGDDLLIGGYSVYLFRNNNVADRTAILAAWFSSESYAAKVNRLLNTGVAGSNGSTIRLTSPAVSDDLTIDTLFGDSGLDWFFAATSGAASEIGLSASGVRDRQLNEILTPLV